MEPVTTKPIVIELLPFKGSVHAVLTAVALVHAAVVPASVPDAKFSWTVISPLTPLPGAEANVIIKFPKPSSDDVGVGRVALNPVTVADDGIVTGFTITPPVSNKSANNFEKL